MRLVVSCDYPDLRLSIYALKRYLGLSLINEVESLSMVYLLDDKVKKCWFDTLQTLLLVSGLLTTSSYQAFYAAFITADFAKGSGSTGQWPGYVAVWFRVANGVSFLASIATITVSAMVVLALNQYVVNGEQVPKFTSWSRVLIYLGYHMAVDAFFVSLAAALVAAGFGAFAFFANGSWVDSIVVWTFLIVALLFVIGGTLLASVTLEEPRPPSTLEEPRPSLTIEEAPTKSTPQLHHEEGEPADGLQSVHAT